MGIAERVDRKITAYGEDYLLNGVTPEKGFFSLLTGSQINTLLDDTEAAVIAKPGLYLAARTNSPISVNDTLTRDGVGYTVRQVVTERFAGVPVVKLAVLSLTSW